MKQLKILLLAILASASMCFMACDDGGSSKSKSKIPSALVGAWEGLNQEDGLTYHQYITMTSGGVFTNHVLYAHGSTDYTAKHWGLMNSNHSKKGSIAAGGGSMTITTNQEYSGENWTAMDTAETETLTYELSADGNTFTVTTDEGSMEFYKAAAPVVDSNLTGTWTASDPYDHDDNSGTPDEAATKTITLGSDGSFSETYAMDDPPDGYAALLYQRSGSYGIYRDMNGTRFFALTYTSGSDKDNPDEMLSVYIFQRIDYILDLFNDPSADELTMNLNYEPVTYTRGGTDPDLPAPDTSAAGSWFGVTEEGGTEYDMIVTLNADNTLERVLLYQQGGSDPGDMFAGGRGQYVANNGEIIIMDDEAWDSSDGKWYPATNDPDDSGYSIADSVLTVISSDDNYTRTTTTLTPFASAPSTSLTGTWQSVSGAVTTTVILGATGTFSMTQVDSGNPANDTSQAGTYGVTTIGTTDYFHLTLTEEDGDTDVYEVKLLPYGLSTVADPDDTLTITSSGGDMVLTKQ
ncbi:MAG TPA: hypothetical protein PK926_03700 [Spirochaetota bacterium]|nr:hypothetical protein [Spirochaetota bacterium]HPI91397.1 hypothetical protein [Spirochaetota bacterium]HPR47082.1 hypothetical protein [Spirochaetota bacterium]